MDKQSVERLNNRTIIWSINWRRPKRVIRIEPKTGKREEFANAYWAAESIVTTSTEIRTVCDKNAEVEEPKFQRKGYYFIWGD